MTILCTDLTEVLLVCKHYDIPANPAEMVLTFPYDLILYTVNGEPMPDEELSFEDFKIKYLKPMRPTFEKTVDILVKAYLNDTLVHGSCYACAVGNIVANGLGTCVIGDSSQVLSMHWTNGDPYPAFGDDNSKMGWGAAFVTNRHESKRQIFHLENLSNPNVKKQIDATGYSWEELARIESAFECADMRVKDRMYVGLMAVVDVLAEIHGISLEQKQEAKALFVKV